MDERKKKIVLIVLMAVGSAYFLFTGFSMLFHEEGDMAPLTEQVADRNSSTPPH
jgi:threonine/homoserine/homoserine lactone efflux protein